VAMSWIAHGLSGFASAASFIRFGAVWYLEA